MVEWIFGASSVLALDGERKRRPRVRGCVHEQIEAAERMPTVHPLLSVDRLRWGSWGKVCDDPEGRRVRELVRQPSANMTSSRTHAGVYTVSMRW